MKTFLDTNDNDQIFRMTTKLLPLQSFKWVKVMKYLSPMQSSEPPCM
jgi:hypothetical protein